MNMFEPRATFAACVETVWQEACNQFVREFKASGTRDGVHYDLMKAIEAAYPQVMEDCRKRWEAEKVARESAGPQVVYIKTD